MGKGNETDVMSIRCDVNEEVKSKSLAGLASDIFNIFCGFGRALVDRDNDSSVLVC